MLPGHMNSQYVVYDSFQTCLWKKHFSLMLLIDRGTKVAW